MKHSQATLDWYNSIITSGTAKLLAPLDFVPRIPIKNMSVSTAKPVIKKIHNQSFENILDIIHN